MRLYYFVATQYAVEDITEGWLKVSRFFELNDPFELYAGEQSDKAFRRKMKGWAKEINEQKGVLCFTKSWHDSLMWSYYGDRHRGVCLGFDVNDSIVERINYRPERLPLDRWKHLDLPNPPKDVTQRLLTTKFDRWIYENERRVIVPLAGLERMKKEGKYFVRRFDHDLKLMEVIAGARCCVEWRRHIKSAVNNSPVRLIKARLAFKQFTVVPQKLGFDSDIWEECSCSVQIRERHDSVPDSTT